MASAYVKRDLSFVGLNGRMLPRSGGARWPLSPLPCSLWRLWGRSPPWEPTLIPHPQPEASSGLWERLRAHRADAAARRSRWLKVLSGPEDIPPQGSDIRGIKQETGSKSSSSSLSRLLHQRVPPGWSRGCSTPLPDAQPRVSLPAHVPA